MNSGYIVASGNLLTDFRSNAAAEGQTRLQTSRIANMTDDKGVRAMLAFNLARDTYHQQQWLLGIEQLIADGFTDGIEDSNGEWEDKTQDRTFWSLTEGSRAGEGRWAQGKTIKGDDIVFLAGDEAQPIGGDTVDDLPAPDPLLFATYDGSRGPGKPGTVGGGIVQGVENLAIKVKDTLT